MLGCSAADPHTLEGTIELAAAAIDRGDAGALYARLDRRARAAMSSIAHDRTAAARMIRADYPEPERSVALAALGDTLDAADPAVLFERRCNAACMARLGDALGAPRQTRKDGKELLVTTSRGGELRFFRGRDGLMGLVWRTQELAQERTRANRELAQVVENARIYRRRRELETGERR